MISFLVFLAVIAAAFLVWFYFVWRSAGRPEDSFKAWLGLVWSAFLVRLTTREDIPRPIIRSWELPEAKEKTPGAHELMELPRESRQEEIDSLNRLLGES